MIRGYDFTDRGAEDFEQVRDWYRSRGEKLARGFINAVVAAIQAARERPESFPTIEGGVRTVRCHRFPYRIYFETLSDRIVIVAIYHTARQPQRWNDPDRQ